MAHSAAPDYYELLGVARDADVAAIRRAYRRLARVSHPDSGGNAGMFRLLRTAYETLTDEAARRRYDAGLDSADDRRPDDAATPGTARAVDPERLSWWSRIDPEAREVVVPPYHRGRTTAAATAGGFVVLGVVMTFVSVTALVPLVAGACLLVATYLRAQGADNNTFAAAAAVAAVAGAALFAYADGEPLAIVLALLALGVLAAAVYLVHRYGGAALLDGLAPPAALVTREFGQPGVSRDQAGAFAERVGADALLALGFLPGVRILHGLAGPAPDQPISHVVTCDRCVAIVESRCWEPGTYGWSRHGALVRDGRHFPGGDLGLDTTLAAYRQLLGDTVRVRGFVLVVTAHEGDVVGPPEDDDVMVGDPQAVVDRLGRWLLDSGTGTVVDRALLLRLHGQLVSSGADEEAT
ncbi:MAG: J domain-containing protein [Acidothermales bacterium]|nr:J domain-containing protein [Acidothermales bacterium]